MTTRKTVNDDWRKMLEAADLAQDLTRREQAHRAEMRRLLLEFLDVFDSLERLMAPASMLPAGSLAALHRQWVRAFERAGVCFFDSVGQPFDPHRQEAMETRADSGHEPGTVVQELRRGCEWQGELLRVARVIVAQ